MLQIDGKGFIKGTNTIYKSKVVVLKRFSTNGRIVLPGDIIEALIGGPLIACLNSGKVRLWDEKKDAPKKETTETIAPDEKKLGPKKTLRRAQGNKKKKAE